MAPLTSDSCLSVKWNPRNPNTTFPSQLAMLHSAFYSLQITIHRPFIASQRRISVTFPQSAFNQFPSLSICTTAARACVHVSETLCRRLGYGTHMSLGSLHHNMVRVPVLSVRCQTAKIDYDRCFFCQVPLFTAAIVLMLNMCAGMDGKQQSK